MTTPNQTEGLAEQLAEQATKAILFEDSGSTEHWEENINLGKAAVDAILAALSKGLDPETVEHCAALIERKHTNNVGMIHPMAQDDARAIRSSLGDKQ